MFWGRNAPFYISNPKTLLKPLKMIVSKKKIAHRPIEIDLTGEQGNAYYLLGLAKSLCNQLGLDYSDVRAEMTESDYENLLKVFDGYFGTFVTMYR